MAKTAFPSDHMSVLERQASISPIAQRNIYFALARATIYLNSALPLLGGALQVWLGAEAFSIFGAVLERECVADPAFNGQWRFAATLWLCYAPLLWVIASDVRRFAPVAFMVAFSVFAGGCAALFTAHRLGIPGTPMGYFVAYISIFLELVVPPFVVGLILLGFRLDRKRS